MLVTTISRKPCQREMCTSVTSLRVISHEPTVITSINTQVVTIVRLSSTKPYRQKTRSSGVRRNAGLLFQLSRLFRRSSCEPPHDDQARDQEIQAGTPRALTNDLAPQDKTQPERDWFAAAGCRGTRAPASRTSHPSGQSTIGRRRKTLRARRRQRAPGQEPGCHSSESSCISLYSDWTQSQALRQPMIKPMKSNMSVQEY